MGSNFPKQKKQTSHFTLLVIYCAYVLCADEKHTIILCKLTCCVALGSSSVIENAILKIPNEMRSMH